MSLQFSSGQLADLCDEARSLVEGTRNHEEQLAGLVATAERNVRNAEAAISRVMHVDVDQLWTLLRSHLEQSTTSAATARRLCTTAHQQHDTARRLLTHLVGAHGEGQRHPNAVLVVDDYGDVREMVASVLQNAGFVVRTAANGLEALIAAYEMRPHVILMDVTMPVLDGISATRLIKAIDATRHARVIAYTGNPIHTESLVENLFIAVLEKPATPDVVVATVQEVAGQ
jgi:CheY-like chemotaxis protein